ncbi:hypothetical protein MBANPS3_003074 [Mucor bainieri]
MYSQSQSEEPESFMDSSLPSFVRNAINHNEEDDSNFADTQAPSDFDASSYGIGNDGIISRPMGGTIDSLTKIWMDERNAPEILQYEHSLVEPLILAIEAQIEKYTLYLLRQPDLKELLSSQEIVYARRYQELIESHNHDSFLHQLPRSQHKQDEISVDMNMVVEPNLDAPVFCRVLSDIGHVEINNDSVLFEPNDIYILRYSDVRDYLKEKKVNSQQQQQQQQASTGHGTVDVPWTEDAKSSVQDNQGISTTSQTQKSHQQQQDNASEKEHTGFGHATQHQHSPRSIKRDLNDI